MSEKTKYLNQHNIEKVRDNIQKKLSSEPFYGCKDKENVILTDYDHFPYTRHFRGIARSEVPVVMEREAGWRARNDHCYKLNLPKDKTDGVIPYPNHCFETGCKTTFPCYPTYLRKYSDKEEMNLLINNSCISQFR